MGTREINPSAETHRQLIHDIEESHGNHYQLWAELIPCEHPGDHAELRFSSVWTGARNPDYEQTRARFLLSPSALVNLQQLLGLK
jgi:hypothetical protein